MSNKPKVPVVVIIAAVLLIVFGGLSVIGGLCGGGQVGMAAMKAEPAGKIQPGDVIAIQQFFIKEIPGYLPVILTLTFFDMAVGLGQLLCAVGLFKLMPMARLAAILLSVGKLLLSFAGHIYSVIFVFPAQARFVQLNPALPAGQQAPFDQGAATTVVTVVIMVLAIVFQIVIAGTIVFLLCTKSSRDAFAGKSPEPPEDADEKKPRRRYEGYDDDDQPPPPPNTGITDRS
jgi:hypothetical protein